MIKIYEIGGDYYAAKNLRDAAREFASISGDTVREALEEMRVLSDAEVDRYHFYMSEDEMAHDSPSSTFRKELDRMIAAGERFPCAFASSNW